ncbi:MAG: UDP-glucose/GDP-mannose dehydrogenase family protein, partial [Myxococcales bacterium]|nr:UDP-glucose/GDP-mannose dehydrogenase family protein [Myxococcales bacterium]
MNVCVVGSGYVGLVTGTCLAEAGNTVHCVDKEQEKIDALLRGEVPIYEPGLGEMIQRNVASRRLTFSTDIAGAVGAAEIVFLTVGTPGRRDGGADLRAVDAVAASVAEHVTHP